MCLFEAHYWTSYSNLGFPSPQMEQPPAPKKLLAFLKHFNVVFWATFVFFLLSILMFWFR